ncbi:MAG: hypothetical protein QM674_09325 [Burkholderiaceae bacterium]
MDKARMRVASVLARWCWIPLLALAGCGGGGGGQEDGSATWSEPGVSSLTTRNVGPASVVDEPVAGPLVSDEPIAYGDTPVDEAQVNGEDHLTHPDATDLSNKSAGDATAGAGTGSASNGGGSSGSAGGKTNAVSSTGTGGTGSTSTGSTSTGSTSTGSAGTGSTGADVADAGGGADSTGSGGASPASGALVSLVQGGLRTTSAEAARLYGPGAYIMDGLWNINAERTSGRDTFAGIRFRAAHSGSVASIRLYWSDGSGYAGGDGGDIEIRLLPDDDSARHLPEWSATPLATGRRVPGSMSMVNGTYTTLAHRFSPDVMSGSGQIEAGKLYHLVAINNAANPSQNWSSWDMAYIVESNGQAARWFDPYDFAALYGWRSAGGSAEPSWQDWTVDGHSSAYVVPIVQITMADGRVFGNSNMETGNVDLASRMWKNGSANPVRERFKPTTNRTVSGLSINTAKVSGSGGLGWRILDGSTVLASGVIDQAAVNYQVDKRVNGTGTGVMTWYDVALPSSVRLDANRNYDVQFTPQGSSIWAFADQRNGGAYGFASPAAFTESQAQHYLDGQWINANHWDKTSSGSGSNWRVVLHQAP